nr:ribosomal protein L7/L12 [Variovorax boronicumulans]
MFTRCVRAAAVGWAVCCGLALAGQWGPAQAAPVVFHKATDNGTDDAAGRFTAALQPGGADNQAVLQLFTAAGPGARITGLYVQDGTGAVARDSISGGPLARLSEPRIHEVVLTSPGANRIAVIKALSDGLGIALADAKNLVDNAPSVVRSAFTPAGNAQLQQALELAGATVALNSRQNPAVPVGANLGVTMPGEAPTGYDVVLTDVGASKLNVIKTLQDLTNLSLAQAKKLVDEAPSVLLANAGRDEAAAMRQALQASGATVALEPVDGTPGQGGIALPVGSTGIVPDFTLGFAYDEPDARPTLQLALDLDRWFADLLQAWQDGRFLLGLRVTDGDGLSDLFLAANDVPPAEVPEPSTAALFGLALLGLLRRAHARPAGARPNRAA